MTKTLNPASAARASNSPFRNPDHPCRWTVVTLGRPGSSASCRGSCSSSTMRTGCQYLMSSFEGCHCLFASDQWKRAEKLVEAIPLDKVVEEVSQRNTRADENGCATQDLWIAMDDRSLLGHSGSSSDYSPPLPSKLARCLYLHRNVATITPQFERSERIQWHKTRRAGVLGLRFGGRPPCRTGYVLG